VAPWLLKDDIDWNVDRLAVPQAPGDTTSTGGAGADEPQTPPTLTVPPPAQLQITASVRKSRK
jgi:hypothetical protein